MGRGIWVTVEEKSPCLSRSENRHEADQAESRDMVAVEASREIHIFSLTQMLTFRKHYYHETTFWQSTTLWFVSLDTKGFRARNCSGLCLNYLIHKSWFLFGGNRNSPCRVRKRYHLLTKCHRMSQHGSMPNSISDERSDGCHSSFVLLHGPAKATDPETDRPLSTPYRLRG